MKILDFGVLLGASVLAGCATVTQGTEQTIAVISEPAGARCTFVRQGATIAVVKSTPDSVTIGKSKNDITVTCNKDQYLEEVKPVASGFQAMTLGNILIGGVIGVAIDAGSGALNKYPELVTLTLDPISFPTAAARDSHYDAAMVKLNKDADDAASRQKQACENDGSDCAEPLKKIEDARAQGLADLEGRRRAARVDVTS